MKQLVNSILDNMQMIHSFTNGFRLSILSKHSLSKASFAILSHIHFAKEISGKELASQLGVTTSAITQIVESLANENLIIRNHNSQDRRIILLSLSKEGHNRITGVQREISNCMSQMLSECSEEELTLFLKLQSKLLEKFNT